MGTGRLRAVLDVTDPEPLSVGHPLWESPGLLLTPPPRFLYGQLPEPADRIFWITAIAGLEGLGVHAHLSEKWIVIDPQGIQGAYDGEYPTRSL